MVNERVDLILCDVVMPGFDGFKFLGLKKAKSEFQGIPVIMLTGNDDLETKVRSLTAGASDYLDQALSRGRAGGSRTNPHEDQDPSG